LKKDKLYYHHINLIIINHLLINQINNHQLINQIINNHQLINHHQLTNNNHLIGNHQMILNGLISHKHHNLIIIEDHIKEYS
jgi:hypothetical protein